MSTTEQLTDWAKTIPLDDLWSEIRKVTGLNDLKFTSKIVEHRGDRLTIEFESQDFSDKIGFLKLMFKEIKITQFNSEVVYKEINGENIPMYWGTAHFDYTHPSGGQNGYSFLTFWYNDKNGWQFET